MFRQHDFCMSVCPTRECYAVTTKENTQLCVKRALESDIVFTVPLASSSASSQGGEPGSGGQSSAPKPLTLAQKMFLARQKQSKGKMTGAGANAGVGASPSPAPDAHATAVCWRPDGRIIAVALSTSKIILVCAEKPSEKWETPLPPGTGTIVDMSWSQIDCSEPVLPGTIGTTSSSTTTAEETTDGFPFSDGALDVLFCLDNRGVLFMFAAGLFLVQKYSFFAARPFDPDRVMLSTLYVPRDMSCVVVSFNLHAIPGDSYLGSTAIPLGGITEASIHALPLVETFTRHKMAILRAVKITWQLCQLSQNVNRTLDTLKQQIKHIDELFNRREEDHRQQLTDNGLTCTPAEDYDVFLTTGVLSPALELFVSTDRQMYVKQLQYAIACASRTLVTKMSSLCDELNAAVAQLSKLPSGDDIVQDAQELVKQFDGAVNNAISHVTQLEHVFGTQALWIMNLPNEVGEALQRFTSQDAAEVLAHKQTVTPPHNPGGSSSFPWPTMRESAEIHQSLLGENGTDALITALSGDETNIGGCVKQLTALSVRCKTEKLACFYDAQASECQRTSERTVTIETTDFPRFSMESSAESSSRKKTVVVACGTVSIARLIVDTAMATLPAPLIEDYLGTDSEEEIKDEDLSLLLHDPSLPAISPIPTTVGFVWESEPLPNKQYVPTFRYVYRHQQAFAWQYFRSPTCAVALLKPDEAGKTLLFSRIKQKTKQKEQIFMSVPMNAEQLFIGEEEGLAIVCCSNGDMKMIDLRNYLGE